MMLLLLVIVMDRVEYNSGSNRASEAHFKLRARLLPELYDTKSNNYYYLINRNYNKIREEYDRLIYSASKPDAEKEPIQVQLAAA